MRRARSCWITLVGLGPLGEAGGLISTLPFHTSVRGYVPDETGDVDVHEGGHEVLAVEAVHDASVTRDGVGKILRKHRGSARARGTGGCQPSNTSSFPGEPT